jgi:hypothetical protein
MTDLRPFAPCLIGVFDCKCFINYKPQYVQPSELVLPGVRSISRFDISISLLLFEGMPKVFPVPNNTVSSEISFELLFNSSSPRYIDNIKAAFVIKLPARHGSLFFTCQRNRSCDSK